MSIMPIIMYIWYNLKFHNLPLFANNFIYFKICLGVSELLQDITHLLITSSFIKEILIEVYNSCIISRISKAIAIFSAVTFYCVVILTATVADSHCD